MTEESNIIRHLLDDSQLTIGTPSKTLIAKYSHHVSALLATYRFLDLELLHNDPHTDPFPPRTLYSNRITPKMIEKVKIKDRWKKLDNWQQLLIEFKRCYNGASLDQQDLVVVDESPFVKTLVHLQGLSESYSNQKFNSLVQNFRGAALHWAFLHEMAHADSNKLPALPDNLSCIVDNKTLFQLHEKYHPNTRQKMNQYLRRHSQGELVLPLHLSLMITPCFLLMQATLVKSKFPRQSIYEVSV